MLCYCFTGADAQDSHVHTSAGDSADNYVGD